MAKMAPWRAVVAPVFCVAVLLAGCSSDADTVDSSADTGAAGDSAETPETGGTLTVLNVNAIQSLDPVKGSANAIVGGGAYYNLYGALVFWDRGTDTIETSFAESAETPDDGTTWEIAIRPDIKFTDGTPYDAAAVVAQWDRVADPVNASPGNPDILDVASYEATGDLTLKVVLKRQNSQWLHTLAQTSLNYIASPTAVAAEGANFGTAPVGAGAFMLNSFTPGTEVSLVKNPDYWDAPKPYLDAVIEKFVPDDTQRRGSFAAGEGDITITNVAKVASELKTVPNTTQIGFPGVLVSGLSLNTTLGPTADPRVRQAIQLALDSTAIAAAWGDEAPTQQFPPGSPYFDPDFELPAQDIEKAQELIDDYVADTGDEVELTYEVVKADRGAEVIQQQLQRLEHVTVTLNPVVVGPEYHANLRANKVMMTYAPTIGDGSCEPGCYNAFHTGNHLLNYSKISDPDVDALLEEARTVSDPDELTDIYRQFQERITELAITIPFVRYVNTWTLYDHVHGLEALWDGALRPEVMWVSPT